MLNNVKAIGATLIISGTMLGAGMLALPLVSEAMGIQYASLALSVLWIIMTYTGLMLLEVALAFPVGAGFSLIATQLFGKKGFYVINICLLLLLYSLSAAYISGGTSSYRADLNLISHFSFLSTIVPIIFTLIIGGIVFISTKAVDRVNRILFTFNIIVFVLMVVLIQPHVNRHYLIQKTDSIKYLFAALPVFLTAFGFHTSIPSMVKYLGTDNPKLLRNTFIIGSLIPLIIYIIWEISTLGLLPRYGIYSFKAVAQHGNAVGFFLEQIYAFVTNKKIPLLLSLFASIALFTSYLCVSLGLFDAIASTIKLTDSIIDRLKTALITYIPPLLFALFYPKGFIIALGAAAIFLAVLAILFPAFALMKLRHSSGYNPSYQLIGDGKIHWLVVIIGVLIIAFQLLKMQGLLPVF